MSEAKLKEMDQRTREFEQFAAKMLGPRMIPEAILRAIDRRTREVKERFAAKRKPLCLPPWRSFRDEPAVTKCVLDWDNEEDYRRDVLDAIPCDYDAFRQPMTPIIARAKEEALAGDLRSVIELLEDAQANGCASLLANEVFAVRYKYVERPKKKYKPRMKTSAKANDYMDMWAGDGTRVDRREASLLSDAEYKCLLYEKFLKECYPNKSKQGIKDLAVKCAVRKFREIEEGGEFDIKENPLETFNRRARKRIRIKANGMAYFLPTITERSLRAHMNYSANDRHRLAPRPNFNELDLGHWLLPRQESH